MRKDVIRVTLNWCMRIGKVFGMGICIINYFPLCICTIFMIIFVRDIMFFMFFMVSHFSIL